MSEMTPDQRMKIERATTAAIQAIVDSMEGQVESTEDYEIMMTAAIRVMCSMAVNDSLNRYPRDYLLEAVKYYYEFFQKALPAHLATQHANEVKH